MNSSPADEVAVDEELILVLLPKSNKSDDSKKIIIGIVRLNGFLSDREYRVMEQYIYILKSYPPRHPTGNVFIHHFQEGQYWPKDKYLNVDDDKFSVKTAIWKIPQRQNLFL